MQLQRSLRILIADPDPLVGERLGPALRKQGHRLSWVGDGNRALETAILQRPDLILIDDGCAYLAVSTFLGILRGNPRTAAIPVIVQGQAAPAGVEYFVQRPAAAEAVLAIASGIQERRGPAPTEGQLAHLSLVDLLQMFSLNRKSGRLLLRLPGEDVEMRLQDGSIHEVKGSRIQGEKAVYRYLGRQDGAFEFRPDAERVPDQICRSVDQLLLEAMRQGDELELLLQELPSAATRLVWVGPPADMPGSGAAGSGAAGSGAPGTGGPGMGAAGADAEVAAVLRDGPLPLAEILDRCASFDLEVARVLVAWLESGLLRAEAEERGVALSAEVLARLRGKARVLLWDVDPEEFPGFLPAASRGPFGLQGELPLDRGVRVELVRLPPHASWAPLARLQHRGALGILARSDVPSELSGDLTISRAAGVDALKALGLLLTGQAPR